MKDVDPVKDVALNLHSSCFPLLLSLPPQQTNSKKTPAVAGKCHHGERDGLAHPGEEEESTFTNSTGDSGTSLARNRTSVKVCEGGKEGDLSFTLPLLCL